VPDYAHVEPYRDASKTCWFNLKFPSFKASLFFTYESPGKDLALYVNDSHTLAYKHLTRATGIRELMVQDPTDRVFGIIYYIDGDVASACQFYFTDSLKHFLRGSLYFDQHTEPDSVAPIRDFLIQDVERIAETLRWKNTFNKMP
jgi:gliding motility-associated lipoprotein GldD